MLDGTEALAFLHGQVSADILGLAPGQAKLAALCSAQGRVISTVRIGRLARGVAVVLPRELAGPVAERLRRFVLRARVTVHDASNELLVAGLSAGDGAWSAPAGGWEALQVDRTRTLVIGPADSWPASQAGAGQPGPWDALCVALGEPEVYAATSEAWVPQMLNLDLLDAVSLRKGCYTGQEVVARVQYLGRLKRRMFRYRFAGAGDLAAGAALCHAGTEVGKVVRLAGGPAEGELLAVVGIESAGLALTDAAGRVTCTPLSLPYAVPEAAADR